MKKRIVSLLLVFCMVFTLLPADVLADEVKSRAETVAGQAQTTGTTAARAGNPFADVKSGSWYEAAVLYARANGFFDGTSATTFEPDGSMTRAMFVTVLGRMAGVEAADYAGVTDFTDVAEGTWYAPFVKWAARYGITTGTGNGKFSPDGRITREEMAVFFVRYFETFDAMPKADTTVTTKPADLDEVSSWAQDAVLKLWALGLLNGDGKSFVPKDKATRAQTAALCERTDKAVETWYSEPGVKSERVSVEPGSAQESGDKKPEEQKPSGGGSSGGSAGGGSTGGGTVTETYYEVRFEVDGVTMPASSVKAGTPISELPTPTKAGAIFLGWFYNVGLTDGAQVGDTVTRNMTLYAKMAEGAEVQSIETPNYVTKTDVPASSFTFGITGVSSITQTGDNRTLRFINVTGGSVDVEYTVSGPTDSVYTVTAELEAGQTYKVELLDNAAKFVLDDGKQGESVRILNILTAKSETKNAALTAEVKDNQIDVGDTEGLSQQVFNGLYQIDENGVAAQNAENGTFTYKGEKPLQVGDVLAVTRGNVNLNDVTSDAGDVAYIKITGVLGGKQYSYEMADVEDVLFMPDVLPIESGWDMDGNSSDTSITVTEENITAAMASVDADSLDEGDFLAFLREDARYNNPDDNAILTYGKIETVTVDDATGQYVITYTPATATDIENSLDVYYTQDREITLTEQEQAQIENEIAVQVRESGYAEEAAVYLAAVILESDDLNTVPDADAVARRMEAMEPVITATGVSVQADGRSVSVEFDPTNIRASVSLNQSLKHLQGNGFGVSVYVPFEVTIGSIKIEVSAQFQEEVILRQSISTSRHKIGFLRYDYSLNASFVVGNYTGINFNATVVTEDSDDDESMTKKLEEIMEQMKGYTETPEMSAADGTMDSLAKIYQDVMKNANDTWIDIVDIKLFENNGSAFLHIFCWQIKGSFVVSANLAVSIGMNFEYTTQKLYNFSVRVKSRTSTNETIDIITPNYTFDFYVVGTIGIRAGLRLEMYVGLFSLKLDKIGITADVGAYAQLWGYFFYHLEWKQGAEKKSNSAGALYIEIGIYLEIHFVAQAFSSSKLTWAPTLYDNQWPLWSAGAQQNVYDFTCAADDPQLNKKIYTATSFPLSATIFDMKVMDMKTGDLSTQNYDSEENADGGEKNFVVTVSNPLFTYDPVSNTVTIDRSGEDLSVEESCDITFTWKSSPLAFTSKPISRTVHILWSDMANARFICFDANGGSGSETVTKLIGQSVTAPTVTRQGYTFAGWYTDRRCLSGTEYSVPDKMQKDESDPYRRGITVYAKWIPNPDTPYTVRHYKQKLDGNYELFETERLTGTTLTKTAAQSKGYDGFRANGVRDLTILPDGSTVVDIYYARWSFKVTFSYGPEGGNQETTVYAKYESTVALPTLELVGYDFAGYQGLEEDTASVPVTGDVTYTAQWTKRGDTAYRVEHYTRRLSGNGYLLTGDDPIVYGKGTTGGQLNISDLDWNRPGLELDHATVNGEAVANDSLAAIGADGKTVIRLYYERRDVTLTLDTRGGSFADGVTPSVTQKYGTALSALPTPTKEGCRFDGWYTDEACTTAFTAAAMPGENTTLYAKWSAKPYTITFKDGETVLATIGKDYGTEITAPENPTKEGYTFAGWDTEIPATMPAKDMTIQAKWTVNRYTITFKDGETVLKSSTQDYGTAIDAPADPTREGYTFAGWDQTVPGTMPAEDMVLTARWTVNRYTITFKDGDEVISAVTRDYAAEVKAPADPTKEGYTFAGWDTEIPATMPARDMTIQAKWTVNKYTITFDTDGGSSIASITQDYGTALTLPTPAKEGYGFGGWYTDLNCTKQFTASAMPAENTTLYAKWNIGEYTLTFDTDGGSVIAPISQKYGTAVAAPTDPTKEGYTFAGWDQAIPATMPARSMTIKAKWTVNKYTITFDTDGGNAIASITQDYGTAITKPTPAKEGYGFGGWYTDQNCTKRFTANTMPAENTTLYAKWNIGEYTLTFDTDGGSVIAPISQKYGTAVAAPTDPTKEGYTFAGWDQAIPATMPARSMTIKAKWTVNKYTITFDTDGGNAIASITQDYGTAITKPADPVKAGYTFIGWDETIPDTMPAKDMTVKAQWTVDTNVKYTVEFYQQDVVGDGYTLVLSEERYGATDTQAELNRDKYDYTRFYEHFKVNYSAPGSRHSGTITGDGSLTLKVYYDRRVYTVTFEPGSTSATLGDSATKEYRYGQKLSDVAVKNPTYNGDWEFVGWYYNGAEFTGTVEGDMTVTAEWKDPKIQFTIAFYKMKLDGTYSTSKADNYWYNKTTTQSKMTIEELLGSAAEETGFEIDCLRAGNYIKPEMNAIVPVDADGRFDTKDIANKTVCVFYERKKYTITWNFDGGTPVDDNYTVAGEYYYETPIKKPTVTKEFYDFEEWETDIWDFSTRPILHAYDASFTAKWTGKTYKVSYDFNGGARTGGITYPSTYTYQNFSPQFPDRATRSGYTFAGWKINGVGETRTGLLGRDLPGGNVKLVAQWTPNSYTVKFFVDEVQQGEALSVRCGEKIPIPAENPTKPHYTFSGWYYSSTKYTAESTMPDQDLDLKAKWTPNQHSVTYVTGCSTTYDPYTGKYGETYRTKVAPYNAGKVFGGWRITSTDADWEPITIGAQETFTMPDGDVTITAIWTNSVHDVKYRNALWLSTGEYLEDSTYVPTWSNEADFPETYTHGDTVTLPTPVAEGFTFDGWKMKSSDEPAASLTLNDSDACYGSTVTLIACWKQIKPTITVDLGNGMEKRSLERQYGVYFPLRDILRLLYADEYSTTTVYPTRDYYTFAGWTVTYTKTGVTETYLKGTKPFDFTVGDSDVEIKAIWTPITYTISFNPGTGGTLSDESLTDGKLILTYPELVEVGGTITLPAAEKADCQFIGWSMGSGQATPWTAITTEDFNSFFYGGATSVTLYANWIEGIQIHSEEELAALAKKVNDGLNQQGKTYILMNDISLSGDWTAIGEISSDEQAKAFYGTFNGNGHTITLNGPQPVFGRVRGTVKDLKVVIGRSITVENVDYWGAVAAVLSNGTIKSCSVVRESGTTGVDVKNGTAVGGVVGWSNGRIEGCRAGDSKFFLYLQTNGTACVGGIVGISKGSGSIVLYNPDASGESEMLYVRIYTTNNASKEQNGVGGIVGYSSSSKNVTFLKANALTQLKVLIDTTGSDTGCVGGIIGNSSGATIDIQPGCPEINLQLRVYLIPTEQGDLIGNQPDTTVSGITVKKIS